LLGYDFMDSSKSKHSPLALRRRRIDGSLRHSLVQPGSSVQGAFGHGEATTRQQVEVTTSVWPPASDVYGDDHAIKSQ